MSKQREAFEAWSGRVGFNLAKGTYTSKDGMLEFYGHQDTNAAWEAWQASRAAALAECIEVCDAIGDGLAELWFAREDADSCSDAILALKEQQ